MQLLLADDDYVSRMMLEEVLLRWGYKVRATGDGEVTWQVLNMPEHPHLLLLDWVMPGIDGLEIVRRLRERQDSHLYYIIIMTARDRPNDVATALDSGADDFIAKPYDVDELRSRVNVGRRVVLLNEALALNLRKLEEAKETISRLADTDELTGLYNRRFFNGRLAALISAARRHQQPLSLIMIDLDHFKKINDTCGHAVGDQVLKEFARLLRELVRNEDIPARWGGEEFIIVLPYTDRLSAGATAERLRSALGQLRLDMVSSKLSASFGVAGLAPDEEADSLIKRADEALYRAKQKGRDGVVVT